MYKTSLGACCYQGVTALANRNLPSLRPSQLTEILGLGQMPLSSFNHAQLSESEPTYPLEVVFSACTLVQITETVPPEILFGNYLYFSSFAETVLQKRASHRRTDDYGPPSECDQPRRGIPPMTAIYLGTTWRMASRCWGSNQHATLLASPERHSHPQPFLRCAPGRRVGPMSVSRTSYTPTTCWRMLQTYGVVGPPAPVAQTERCRRHRSTLYYEDLPSTIPSSTEYSPRASLFLLTHCPGRRSSHGMTCASSMLEPVSPFTAARCRRLRRAGQLWRGDQPAGGGFAGRGGRLGRGRYRILPSLWRQSRTPQD